MPSFSNTQSIPAFETSCRSVSANSVILLTPRSVSEKSLLHSGIGAVTSTKSDMEVLFPSILICTSRFKLNSLATSSLSIENLKMINTGNINTCTRRTSNNYVSQSTAHINYPKYRHTVIPI